MTRSRVQIEERAIIKYELVLILSSVFNPNTELKKAADVDFVPRPSIPWHFAFLCSTVQDMKLRWHAFSL